MIRIQQRNLIKFFSNSRTLSSSNLNPNFDSSNSSSQESKVQQLINADLKCNNPVPVFKRALLNSQKTAIKDINGEKTYLELISGSFKLSKQISDVCAKESLAKVAFLCNNDISYILSQWATWMSGQIAIPLSTAHPVELLEFYIQDSETNLIITTPQYEEKLKPLADKLKKPLHVIDQAALIDAESTNLDEESLLCNLPKGSFYKKSPALFLYTSGTTSKPKGVQMTYSNLEAQVSSLQHAWNIQSTDTILHALPLHHTHGIINALLLPLSAGGKVIMLPKFESDNVWSHLLNINMPQKDRVTVFMGIPTIFNYLIQEYDKLFSKSSQMTEYIKTHCQNKIRLMICGSAPLPNTVFQRWKDITGHKLLERYGMTEIGMCLSNPLTENKVRQRLPGFVGQPLPGVKVRVANAENPKDILLEASGEYNKGIWSQEQEDKAVVKIKQGLASDAEIIGSLQVQGPSVFKEYWNRESVTKEAFTEDGFFITGDTACYDPTVNSFKIMGRNSVDILKSKGYKISALEIETKLLENPLIEDCAVIGVPDEVLGQKIIALIVKRVNKTADESTVNETDNLLTLKKWCESKFASYSMPTLTFVSRIPRNQLGKVNKAELVKDFVKKANEVPAK
ncbi:hypothetical protein PVAND_004302 [Polypedilum vanderplanki]|uniref:Uncharacterized protein n=1 Tax=Polypedilum vanderplanki TaxID=319348 RepID=A0A9J6BYQ4_POLVA|nr:hypothetical protein PVAND_004302 [Polypedilum vanderplanki]